MPSLPANARDSADPLLPGPYQHSTNNTTDKSFDDDEFEPSALFGNMGISYSTAKWLAPASFLYVNTSDTFQSAWKLLSTACKGGSRLCMRQTLTG